MTYQEEYLKKIVSVSRNYQLPIGDARSESLNPHIWIWSSKLGLVDADMKNKTKTNFKLPSVALKGESNEQP